MVDFDTTLHVVTECDTCGLTSTAPYPFHVTGFKGDENFMLSRMVTRLHQRGAGTLTCIGCLQRERDIYV